MADPITPHSTGERLRSDIDTGRTGDKVAFPDPATAPLPTDAEAGGTATRFSPEPDRGHLANRNGPGGLLAYIIIIGLIALAAVALIWWGTSPR